MKKIHEHFFFDLLFLNLNKKEKMSDRFKYLEERMTSGPRLDSQIFLKNILQWCKKNEKK